MVGFVKIGCVILLIGSAQYSGDAQDGAAICRKIQSFVHDTHSRKDPRLVEYLKSLRPEEALAAARYACAETANNPEFQELPAESRSIGAAKSALLCLSYFFHNCESIKTGGDMLVKVAADKREHPSLRLAIVASMTGGTRREKEGKGGGKRGRSSFLVTFLVGLLCGGFLGSAKWAEGAL